MSDNKSKQNNTSQGPEIKSAKTVSYSGAEPIAVDSLEPKPIKRAAILNKMPPGRPIQPVNAQTADPRPVKDTATGGAALPPKNKVVIIPDEGGPNITVSTSPHVNNTRITTRKIMLDVIISLCPLVIAALIFFQFYAVRQIVISVACCLVAELIFTKMRHRAVSINDLSAVVTGLILALSMPATAPWYVTAVAAFAAIGIGKAVFGGLGMNIFNPAMVGRAFVMIAFAGAMAASGYTDLSSGVDIITQATPLTAFKQNHQSIDLFALIIGNANGSLGETSAIACIIGGIYLLARKIITWEIPVGVLVAVIVISLINALLSHNSLVSIFSATGWSVLHQVCGGAVLFGAFFIASDPVTSPFTARGKWIFGLGVGFFIMILRIFSGYPEGVMFAVLIMNSLTPLINRWTIPAPFGGFLKQDKGAQK